MNIRNALLVPVLTISWACLVQAAAPGAAWTVRQNFPVNRDCRVNASTGDAQGNLYLAGSIENGANEDYYVCKIDGETDSIVWSMVYNGPDDDLDQATGCCLDSSGNLYVTGFSHNGDDFDALTIKYDAVTGAEGWVKRYNIGVKTNEYAASCAADRFGNLYIAGTCRDTLILSDYDEYYHAFVLKYEGASGDTVWSHSFNELPDSVSEASDCCVDDSGNVYIVGYVSTYWGSLSSLVIKLHAAGGDTVWVRRHNATDNEIANGCFIDGTGNMIVIGSDDFADQITAIRYNTGNGDTIWSKSFPTGSDPLQGCAMVGSNEFLVSTGSYFGDQYTLYKMRIDTSSTLWSRTFPVMNGNKLLPLAVMDSNVFYVSSSNMMGNIYVPKLRCYGIYTARHSVNTGDLIDSTSQSQNSAGGWNFAYDCAVSGSNGPVVVGSAGTFYAAVLYDPSDGHIAWEKRDPDEFDPNHYNNARATGAAQVGGHVYTTGYIGTMGLLTYKFDIGTGDTLWNAFNTYGFSYARGGDCIPDKWGNLFVSGYDEGIPIGLNASIAIRYDQATGDTTWTNRDPELYRTVACTVDSAGAFYLLGRSSFGYNMITKYENSTGDTVWSRWINIYGDARGISYGNGSIYVAGTTDDGAGPNYFLAKYSISNGDSLWCRRFDSPYHSDDRAKSCAVDDSGFIYLTGASYNGSDYDFWTIKCNQEGDSLWSTRYNDPDGKNDFGRGCCVDSLGYLYITGFSATGRGYDMVTIKYNTSYTGVTGGPLSMHDGRYFLGSVYPNPSPGGKVALWYELPATGQVSFEVYNITGQLVKTLDQGEQSGGTHQLVWDGTDRQGVKAASGVYILRCDLGGSSATRKMLVIR